METGLELPNLIRNAIANCYAREYAWHKFERGFAVILSQHLSAVQIDLLIGFYRNQGIPPNGIQHFKDAIASASASQGVARWAPQPSSTSAWSADTRTPARSLPRQPN